MIGMIQTTVQLALLEGLSHRGRNMVLKIASNTINTQVLHFPDISIQVMTFISFPNPAEKKTTQH